MKFASALMTATITTALSVSTANAAEIKILIAGALQNAVRPLAADFEKQTGNKVTIAATNPALVMRDFNAGQFDVVAAAVPSMAELTEAMAVRYHAARKTGRRRNAPRPTKQS